MTERQANAGGGPARRGRAANTDPAALRARIIDAAMDAFAQRGFARTTTADIARAARVSKRDLYAIFDTKEALFAALVRSRKHLILALPRPAGEDLHGLAALQGIFRLDLPPDEADARDGLLNLVARESLLLPELNALLYDGGVIDFRELLIDWLQGEIRTGHWPDCDPENIAGLLMDVVFGALLPRRMRQDIDRARQAREILERLEILRRGLAAHPGQGCR